MRKKLYFIVLALLLAAVLFLTLSGSISPGTAALLFFGLAWLWSGLCMLFFFALKEGGRPLLAFSLLIIFTGLIWVSAAI